jgi:hypothetical protein
LVALVCLLLLLEAGWVALWPLSGALSHSVLFNAAFLKDHPLVASLFARTSELAHQVLPGLRLTPLEDPVGTAVYVVPTYALALLFLLLGATYLLSLIVLQRVASRARMAALIVLVAAGIFQLTLLYLPGLFSQDVFSYIAYGRLSATYDLNPYVWPPSVIPRDGVLPWVAPVWRGYAAPYGPLWLEVQLAMSRVMGGMSIEDQALGYRYLANALLAVNLVLLWAILKRTTLLSRAQRVTALAALAWNPLMLFEASANAHNDVLMVTASLVALLVLARRPFVAGASFLSGALIKYLSGPGVVWVGVALLAHATSSRRRLLRIGVLVAVCAIVVLAATWPWLELPDSLDPLIEETAYVGYVNSLPDSLAVAFADGVLQPGIGLQQALARDMVRTVERLVELAGFVVYLVWEARQVAQNGSVAAIARATGRACLVYVLLVSTSTQTWYFCLPLAMVLALGWQNPLARVTLGYSVLALPALYISYYLRDLTPLAVYLVYGAVPLLGLVGRKRRRGSSTLLQVGGEEVLAAASGG